MAVPAAGDARFVTRLLALAAVLTTVPSFFAYQAGSLSAATLWLWLFVPGVYFYIGPVLGLLANVMPAGMRATACAILLFLANVANLFLAPRLLVGPLSDWFAASFNAGPRVAVLGAAAPCADGAVGRVAPVARRGHDPRGRGARALELSA